MTSCPLTPELETQEFTLGKKQVPLGLENGVVCA